MDAQKKEKKPRLGRGLSALLGDENETEISSKQPAETQSAENAPEFPEDKVLQNSVEDIPLDKIIPNPYQPRTVWDEGEIAELAESVKKNGLIQPILVRKMDDKYELIAGERRYRACCQAGLETIPAMVRKATDNEMLELALIENIHRTDLNPVERAQAYRSYIETFGLNQTEAAQRLGEDRSVLANHLRILDLPLEIREMLIRKDLSMGHARAILGLPDDQLRRKLANRAHAGRLSVREVEHQVRKFLEGAPGKAKKPREKAPHILDLERRLRDALGTKVEIKARRNGQKGRIIIEFYSLDDFERLSEMMGAEEKNL